ncbi:hypothetical protein pdam_00016219 [Pocillopora damicornis]|uniref:Uncharacterized protein n=1 Tax=Pocillopora damicornis TaxID=46731 RepID=A0A3M6U0X2_POCDA|nr:hypothetical protein pdam_00016219 [Pocillopora damicornis]
MAGVGDKLERVTRDNNWILFCDRDGNLLMNTLQDSLSLQRNLKWRNMPQRSHSILRKME